MNANELRIGNKVLNDNVENTIVGILEASINIVNLKTKQGNVINANLDLIKPIPLTEEWLLKFGFKFDGTYYRINTHKNQTFSIPTFLNKDRTLEFMAFMEEIGLKLLHVHQLQNLYFALTGKELMVNIEPKQK